MKAGGGSIEELDERIRILAERPQQADLEPGDRAIVDYALKLTESPGSIVAEDIDTLRSHGFSDRGVHDLAAIVSYFAFVNRIADGLGIEMEQKA